jgi:transposase
MDEVSDDAKHGGFRRIEVLTGPGRPREWSEDRKARIVAETLVPGAEVAEVARRSQVCPQQVFGWRRERRLGGSAELAPLGFVEIVPETLLNTERRSGPPPDSNPKHAPLHLVPRDQGRSRPTNYSARVAYWSCRFVRAIRSHGRCETRQG